MSLFRINYRFACFIFAFILLAASSGKAQEHVIGPEDMLEINFWQDPQLNTTIKVNRDGRIALPIIGSITASGLTPGKLSQRIVDKISIYNRSITQASVVVTSYGSNKIYLAGSVLHPGKYTFEVIPTLWEAILEAGGPAEVAALSKVTIIRGGIDKGKRIVVDLSKILQQGDMSQLQRLHKGDTVYVPAVPRSASQNRLDSPLNESDMVYIYGQVNQPGNYSIPRRLPLIEALAIAGGITERADLTKIRVIMRGSETPAVAIVDLEDNEKLAGSTPFLLRPNDTVIVPVKKQSVWSGMLGQGVIGIITTTIAALISVTLYQGIN